MSDGKIICVMNRKGGVGKTTLSVALADTIVSEHNKATRVFQRPSDPETPRSVALVDLDPQGSASRVIMQDNRYLELVNGGDAHGQVDLSYLFQHPAIQADELFERLILKMQHRITGRGHVDMALIANCEKSWTAERDVDRKLIEERTAQLLEHLRTLYHYVIIDTPPGFSQASETAASCADFILSPVTPDRLAQWGMEVLHAYLKTLPRRDQRATPYKFVLTAANMQRVEAQKFESALQENEGLLKQLMLVAESGDDRGSHGVAQFSRTEKVRARIQLDRPKSLERIYGGLAVRELRAILTAVDKEMVG